jgi:hypothetical protein
MSKTNRLERAGIIKQVRLDKMYIPSRHAQREKLVESRVLKILADFDLDKIGIPEVSERPDGMFYTIDGQHRREALIRWLGPGWESSTIPCLCYQGLSEAEEADKFLSLQDKLTVQPMDKFRVAVAAGHPDEVHIQHIVMGAGLCISRDKVEGSLSCVSTLKKIYTRADGDILARALRIARDSFGTAGLEGKVVEGMGYLAQRYNGVLDEDYTIKRLSATRGGVSGLRNKADVLHKQTGNAVAQCIAAAAVEIINTGIGPRAKKRLPAWWKT